MKKANEIHNVLKLLLGCHLNVCVAKWLPRLTSNQAIAGSSPAVDSFLLSFD